MGKLRMGVELYESQIRPAERLLKYIDERLSKPMELTDEATEHLTTAKEKIEEAVASYYRDARYAGQMIKLRNGRWIFADLHCCPDMKGLKAMLGIRNSAMKDQCGVCDVQVRPVLCFARSSSIIMVTPPQIPCSHTI
jgi:hypothetical protein